MGRYYKRRRYYRRRSSFNMRKKDVKLLVGILCLPFILAALVIKLIIFVVKKTVGLASREPPLTVRESVQATSGTKAFEKEDQTAYSAKDSLMTECEKKFFQVIKDIAGASYIVQPQVNLASIIDKESTKKYRNELFRNIDVGIFDFDYKPVLLIEINDPTHKTKERRDRDIKVHKICEAASIPLITFWTDYGVDEGYNRYRMSEHLPLV